MRNEESSSQRGRQQRGEATRNDIIGVARRLFSDFGYHNTGIADIQAATGMTKGAFYHHFRSKQDLALAVLEAARSDYLRQVIEPAQREADAGRRLSTLLDRIIEVNGQPEWQNCRLLATMCAEVTVADGELLDAVRGIHDQLFETVELWVGEAQQAGQASSGPSKTWAQIITGCLMGLQLIRKIEASRVDLAGVVEQIRQSLLIPNR